jgi:hypothetical protein
MKETKRENPGLLTEYIQKSVRESQKSQREYSLYGKVLVYVQDFPSPEVDLVKVVQSIEDTIPHHLAFEIDTIFIGDYDILKNRAVTAMYESGAIYVSNSHPTTEDMVDDIIHEMAHSLEIPYGFYLYSDQKMETEFLQKRMALFDELVSLDLVPASYKKSFLNAEYSKEFDELLYKQIGYDTLNQLVIGIYTTPYAATALREYFATGIEDFFVNDRNYLKKICPKLYTKIEKLVKGEYNEQ